MRWLRLRGRKDLQASPLQDVPAQGLPKVKAETTLARILGPTRLHQLDHEGGLRVPSLLVPGWVYVIRRGQSYVDVLEDGTLIDDVCVKAEDPIPEDDEVLARLFHIETNEADFVRTGYSGHGYVARRRINSITPVAA